MPPRKSKTPRGKPADVPLDKLARDPRLQMREGPLNQEHVQDIAAALKARQKIERPRVFDVDGTLYVTRGFHRTAGYELAGKKTVPCSLFVGTWQDAVLDAAASNQEHTALKRTNADKRRSVLRLLAEFPDMSGRKLAEIVGVSHEFANSFRRPEKTPDKVATVATPEPAPFKEDAEVAAARDTPLRDFLTAAEFVWKAIDKAGVETCGQMVDVLAAGKEDFGLKGSDFAALKGEFDDLMQYARPAAKPDKFVDPRPKAGTPVFDWADADRHLGNAVRLLDAVVNFYPAEKKGENHRRCQKHADALAAAVHEWRDRLAPNPKKAG